MPHPRLNDAMLWMDPIDYGEGLAKAVNQLSAAGVNVSVYNLPKCVLPRSVWPHAPRPYRIGKAVLSNSAISVMKKTAAATSLRPGVRGSVAA
jgi:hypothetical protein